jgi:cytochrome c
MTRAIAILFRILYPGLGLIASSALSTGASAAGDPQAGHDLARSWCSGCHLIESTSHGGDAAPPFATIAAENAGDPARLRGWLTDPHPPMPNLNLSRAEIEDIIAYLMSLAPR